MNKTLLSLCRVVFWLFSKTHDIKFCKGSWCIHCETSTHNTKFHKRRIICKKCKNHGPYESECRTNKIELTKQNSREETKFVETRNKKMNNNEKVF